MARPASPTPGNPAGATVQTLRGTAEFASGCAAPSELARAAAAAAAASSRPAGRSARQPQRATDRAASGPDELAQRRQLVRAERQEIETRADTRLHEMQAREFIRVPRLMVALTNSLAAASVLELVRLWTERSLHERGTPWVDMPVQTWLNYTGLCEQEWVEARRALRAQGLIHERRRFDLDRNELVCDVAFEPQAFADHVANLKDALKAHLAEEVRARRRVAHPAQRLLTADSEPSDGGAGKRP